MITDEILCVSSMNTITELLAASDFPQDAFVLVECFPQQVVVDARERQHLLRFARLSDGIDVTRYTSGRIFYQDFELRWERDINGNYRVVYLGTERKIQGLQRDEKELEKLERREEPRYYYLFGEYLNTEKLKNMGLEPGEGYYAEVRIPRLLHYPAPEKARRVQLVVREYVDEETGQLRLFRFQGLRSAEEEA
jgi:hypothetical protein